MEYIVIPNDDLGQLLCSSCGKYLSVFPIHLKGDTSSAICGRCTPTDQEDLIRDEAYETIAEFLLFPCSNKIDGCEEKLNPERLKKHEIECVHRKCGCPSKLYTRCDWQGATSQLIDHFEQNHPSLLLTNYKFEWDLTATVKENFLFRFEKELFIIEKDADARMQTCSITIECFEGQDYSSREFSCMITFLTEDERKFKLPLHNTRKRGVLQIDTKVVKQELKDPITVQVQIEIIKPGDVKENAAAEAAEPDKNTQLNWDALKELECPICLDIMSSPIYQCSKGHSICKKCKGKVKKCPLCNQYFGYTRNYALEKVSEYLIHPCKFIKTGCTHTGKSSDIKTHEAKCEFAAHNCPLKQVANCQVTMPRASIVDHVELNHGGFMLTSNRVKIPFNPNETTNHCYVIKSFDKMFLVKYKYATEKFYWTVQMVGSKDECEGFKFDIDVVDNSKHKLRCYLTGSCVPIHEEIDFKDARKYIVLTYEQLKPLITTLLYYNIHIVKD